jgi:hypothetical protein
MHKNGVNLIQVGYMIHVDIYAKSILEMPTNELAIAITW